MAYSKQVIKLPFPFVGNKHKILNRLDKINFPINKDTLIVDVFGGSGLLTSYFNIRYPNNKIIYNDYSKNNKYFISTIKNDDLISRINKFLDYANILTESITREDKLPQHISDKIYKYILKNIPEYNNTYIVQNIINSNISFNSSPLSSSHIMYNRLRKTHYPYFNEYQHLLFPNIQNIKFEHLEYKSLLSSLKNYQNIFYIIDPPYIHTRDDYYSKTYNISDLLNILYFTLNHKCILFESLDGRVKEMFKLLAQMQNFKKYKIIKSEDTNEIIILTNL